MGGVQVARQHDKAQDTRVARLRVTATTQIKNYHFSDPLCTSPTVHLLGLGGSSLVYKVYQELDAKAFVPRAMKLFVLRADVAPDDAETSFVLAQENFLEEVRNISQLSHESLVQVTDAGVATLPVAPDNKELPVPYVVSHLIEGCTLRDVIDGGKDGADVRRLLESKPDIGLDLVLQVARGIAYLHERGLLHCDIAPKNIFINTAHGTRAIVGDVGMSRSVNGDSAESVFIAGTRSYSPADIATKFGTKVSLGELRLLFPRWDLFGFAKTAHELLRSVDPHQRIPWLTAAQRIVLDPRRCSEDYRSISELAARLEYCRPVHRQRGRVEELEPNLLGSSTRLMPIEGLSLTRRVDRLVRHPAIQRLHGVPQLTVVKSTAPGGSHTRYEHSLGVMENMRRMLSALIDNPDFLEVLSEVSIETGLVAALLHNATRFPFSNIVHEINKRLAPAEQKPFPAFSRDSLFSDVLGDQFRSITTGQTLSEMIAAEFPAVDMTRNRLCS
jgi:hypothetical protein